MSKPLRHSPSSSSNLGGIHPPDEFEVDVLYGPDLVTLQVHGELNGETAAELDGLLRAVVGVGSHRVMLDLADVASIEAAVSGVVASSAAFVVANGGLTIRSASRRVRHLLDLAHMSSGVKFESPRARPVLGSEQTTGDHSVPVTRPNSLTIDDIRSLKDHAASPAVLDAALRLVVAVAARTVRGADGVSITLRRDGTFMTAAASDDTIAALDRGQYATGQGPCLAAANEGRWFHIESIAEEARWPEFVPQALSVGVGSVLSTPILGPWRSIGALSIYSNSTRPFGWTEQALTALLATQASGIVADAGLGPFAVNLGGPSGLTGVPAQERRTTTP